MIEHYKQRLELVDSPCNYNGYCVENMIYMKSFRHIHNLSSKVVVNDIQSTTWYSMIVWLYYHVVIRTFSLFRGINKLGIGISVKTSYKIN